MTIETKKDNGKLTIAISGRLNAMSSPELEEVVYEKIEGMSELVFDFGNLEYISSSGLRIMAAAQDIMDKQGAMKITNINPDIMELLEEVGFDDFIKLERAEQ